MAQLTPKQLAAARDWLCDCTWADTEPAEFEVMSANDIERGIARFFQGGIAAFVASCNPAEQEQMPRVRNDPLPVVEAHDADRTKATPGHRKCPQTHDTLSPEYQIIPKNSTPEINLFGQYQPTPIKGRQLPLFHEPVDVPIPDKRSAIDKRIARKFDEAATPSLFAEQTKPVQS